MDVTEHLNNIRPAANEAKRLYRSLDDDGKAAFRENRRLRKNAEVLARYYRNRETVLARMKAKRDADKASRAE